MTANEPKPNRPRKRKSYKRPTLTKLTAEEAKALLEAKAIPGDEHAQQLLEAARRQLKKQ
jgi:hypothetical protein